MNKKFNIKTPLDGLPSFDKKSYRQVLNSSKLKLVKDDDVVFDRHYEDEPDTIYFLNKNTKDYSDEIFIIEVIDLNDRKRKFLLTLNIIDSVIGAVFNNVEDAIMEGKSWMKKGVADAVIEARPDPRLIAEELDNLLKKGRKLSEFIIEDDPWGGPPATY